MSKRLDVIYENGVFRPLAPVHVPEHQRMTIGFLRRLWYL
jgi:predicted DNA-binding antitoxin AbrB/MazE fold protein